MSYPPELRSSVVSTLSQIEADLGFVPERVVSRFAEELKMGRSTIRRWLKEERGQAAQGRRSKPAKLEDEHIEVIFKNFGQLKNAKRELDKRYPDLFKDMSYGTFRRRWLAVPLEIREMARGGAEALVKVQPKMLHEEAAPNDVWHIDHQELPVWMLPRGHRTNPVKPWLTTVIDDRTRRIMSVLLTVTAPNTETTMVVLADAMLIRPLSVDDRFVGGVPAAVHSDNGGDFRSDQYIQFLARLQITRKLTFPYQKHQNGKVERVQLTLQQDLIAGLPGYSEAPVTLRQKDIFGKDGPVMDEDTLWELVLEWVDAYNSERPHSALKGKTPNQVWAELDPPLRQADPEAVRLAMLVADKPRKVQPTGVRFEGQYYTSPELAAAGLVGAEVTVRYMPHNLSFIEVYHEEKRVATAYPHQSLTDEQRAAIDQDRRARYLDAKSFRDAAAERRRLEADIDPDALVYTKPAMPAGSSLEADDEALFELAEDPSEVEEDQE